MKIRAILGTSGWILALALAVAVWMQRRELGRARGNLERCEAESASEPVLAVSSDGAKEQREFADVPPQFSMQTGVAGMRAENACLNDPVVRTEIERRAAELATGLTENRIEKYRREEASRRLQRRARFMDSFEEASTGAIDAFAKEKGFDEESTAQLHRIFDENIKRQREIFEKLQSGQIDEAAARQEGQALREETRRQVEKVLGEEGAAQFARAIGEQMRARFERDRPGPPGE